MAKITDVLMKCNCGWQGRVIDCDCDADLSNVEDDGRLRCPECWCVVEQSEKQDGE